MEKVLKLYNDNLSTIEASNNPFRQEMRAFAQTREMLVAYVYCGCEGYYNNLNLSDFMSVTKNELTITETISLLEDIGIDVGDECKKLIEFSKTCTVGKIAFFIEHRNFIRKLIAQKLKELLESRK